MPLSFVPPHLAQNLHGPSLCEICRSWNDRALCTACVTRFAPQRPRCARCGLATGMALAACGACLREAPPFEHTVCVADYGFPWDRLIAELKFHERSALAGALAPLLAQAVRDTQTVRPKLVVPVPLSAARLSGRGYNQAWELARRVAGLLSLPARADVLLRPVATAQQHELQRQERQRNLRGAFMVAPALRHVVQGLRIALVDDVMTSGATARETAAALLRAGAAAIDVWVLARTPEH